MSDATASASIELVVRIVERAYRRLQSAVGQKQVRTGIRFDELKNDGRN
jgi:hypothetical protein